MKDDPGALPEAAPAARPSYAVFDDFARDQVITVYIRWALIALFLYTNHFRTTTSVDVQAWVDLILIGGVVVNGYLHWRIHRGRPLGRPFILVTAIFEGAAISGSVALTGGFRSGFYVLYFPSLLAFAVSFPRLWSLGHVTGIGAAYLALSLLVDGGISAASFEDKGLTLRLVLMAVVALVGNWVVRSERRKRHEAVAAERQQQERNLRLYRGALAALARAVEAKDEYTGGHIERVVAYSERLGRALGLTAGQLATLNSCAMLHDVGKLSVPDQVLNKAGKLTPEEWAVMKQHPLFGERILSVMDTEDMAEVMAAIGGHHEWVNGSGYPRGRKGAGIPLYARIIAVADTFDALTTDRPYRAALPREQALEVLREERGSHLDAALVDRFIEDRLHGPADLKALGTGSSAGPGGRSASGQTASFTGA